MKSTSLILLVIFTLTSCALFTYAPVDKRSYNSSSQRVQEGMPIEPGACFAKCLIQDEFKDVIHEFAVFTGEKQEANVILDTILWESVPAHTAWEKKVVDKNCLSDDPKDCLVWCLVNVPAQSKTLVVVNDTLLTDNYEIITENRSELVQEGGFTEWRKVICDKDLNTDISIQIQEQLKTRGLYEGDINGILKSETREALVHFQKINGLPVGQLDLDTLDALEVDY